MSEITTSPLFGIVLCIFVYEFSLWLNKKLESPLVNPLLVSIGIIILLLKVCGISIEDFNVGGDIINMFLAPATCALAVSIYRQIEILKKNFLPVVCGCMAGAVVSMTSSYFLCKAFGLEDAIARAAIPKSVTTPIAMEVSEQIGGIVPITIAMVLITGVIGCVCAPMLIKLLHIEDPVAAGVAIGASSHALGTTKAVELGEIQGAMSGIAIGVSGIITVILALFL